MRPEFASLRNHPGVSVLIIGGGINGIGLLGELALQGIDVLLVDKSDFCAAPVVDFQSALDTFSARALLKATESTPSCEIA
jgi:heterodisulfide reductase subunit A-like polyferredoxin